MGLQYLDTIGMYGKKEYKEYPSEFGGSIPRENKTFSDMIADMVFNKQYGIFYYEPSDEAEAKKMIDKFEEKIKELKEKWLK